MSWAKEDAPDDVKQLVNLDTNLSVLLEYKVVSFLNANLYSFN